MVCTSRFATAILSGETELALGTIKVKTVAQIDGHQPQCKHDIGVQDSAALWQIPLMCFEYHRQLKFWQLILCPFQLYFLVAGLEREALFMACDVTWPESPSLFPMIISKFTCVWDPSRNWKWNGISYQNSSCLWYYSKHIRDICQGAAESCTPMSCLHWGWWPSIWATVVRCKMVR